MSRVPYLNNLGDEMRRATLDDVCPQTAPAPFRAVFVVASIAAAVVLLLITWGPSLTSGPTESDDAVASHGKISSDSEMYASIIGASEMEVLAISFESIRAESGLALTTEPATASAREAKGPYPRSLLDAMGPDFNVLYVPGFLPEGFSLYGKLRLGDEVDRAPRVQTQLLKYNDHCFFVIEQFARGFTPRSIEDLSGNRLRPVDVDGLRLYTTRSDSDHLIYFFEKDGTWFDVIGRSPKIEPGLTAADVAKMAKSLQPFATSAWGDEVAVVPTVTLRLRIALD